VRRGLRGCDGARAFCARASVSAGTLSVYTLSLCVFLFSFGCRGRRRRQPIAAGSSKCIAQVAALAIAVTPVSRVMVPVRTAIGARISKSSAPPGRARHRRACPLIPPFKRIRGAAACTCGPYAYCVGDNWLVSGRPTGGFRFSARKRQKLDGFRCRPSRPASRGWGERRGVEGKGREL